MPETLNIYQKLAKVRKRVEVIQRNKTGYGYNYVSDDEILAKITGQMERYALSLIPSVVPGTCTTDIDLYKKTKSTKDGKIYEETVHEMLIKAEMMFSWVNNDNPDERIDVPWVLIGHQSDASQAFGSGLTYAMRYFLLKYFNIATPNDDPDNWRSKQKASAAEEDRLIAEQIVKSIDESVRGYLSIKPDAAADVKTFLSKYVKGGDYFKLKEPVLASKLLEDFKQTFAVQP